MTWIKLDDRAPRHPKIAGLSDRAFRWWIAGLCYASEFLTDGLLPFTFTKQIQQKAINELRDARLWAPVSDGIMIHDYLAHQSGRASVESERASGRERAARSRLVRANRNRSTCDTVREKSGSQRSEIREVQEPPLPPSGEGGVGSPERILRDEQRWAETMRQELGRCPHSQPCPSEYFCQGRLIEERRADLANGRKVGAA